MSGREDFFSHFTPVQYRIWTKLGALWWLEVFFFFFFACVFLSLALEAARAVFQILMSFCGCILCSGRGPVPEASCR